MKNSYKGIIKNTVKKVCLSVLTIAMLASFAGCGETTKTVKSEDMKITRSKEYQKGTLANATWYYTSPDGLAMGIRSMKDDVEKSGLEVNSAQDYAEAYIKANSIPGSPKVESRQGYVYFSYKKKVSGTDYSYLTCVYEHDDEYWLVNFACYKELYSEYKNEFFKSADSVEFIEKSE